MLTIQSSAFQTGGLIPAAYTCDGENKSPPLSISGVPEKARSLALIVEDPDIPESVKNSLGARSFDHWIVFDTPPNVSEIEEGSLPHGTEGRNTRGNASYTGPCPPDREHRYFFRLYALDTMLRLPEGASRLEVEKAMEGHILESAELLGRYDRPR